MDRVTKHLISLTKKQDRRRVSLNNKCKYRSLEFSTEKCFCTVLVASLACSTLTVQNRRDWLSCSYILSLYQHDLVISQLLWKLIMVKYEIYDVFYDRMSKLEISNAYKLRMDQWSRRHHGSSKSDLHSGLYSQGEWVNIIFFLSFIVFKPYKTIAEYLYTW